MEKRHKISPCSEGLERNWIILHHRYGEKPFKNAIAALCLCVKRMK